MYETRLLDYGDFCIMRTLFCSYAHSRSVLFSRQYVDKATHENKFKVLYNITTSSGGFNPFAIEAGT